jgi:hypothetical protein
MQPRPLQPSRRSSFLHETAPSLCCNSARRMEERHRDRGQVSERSASARSSTSAGGRPQPQRPPPRAPRRRCRRRRFGDAGDGAGRPRRVDAKVEEAGEESRQAARAARGWPGRWYRAAKGAVRLGGSKSNRPVRPPAHVR